LAGLPACMRRGPQLLLNIRRCACVMLRRSNVLRDGNTPSLPHSPST
jgi:hypothetical protein